MAVERELPPGKWGRAASIGEEERAAPIETGRVEIEKERETKTGRVEIENEGGGAGEEEAANVHAEVARKPLYIPSRRT